MKLADLTLDEANPNCDSNLATSNSISWGIFDQVVQGNSRYISLIYIYIHMYINLHIYIYIDSYNQDIIDR